MRSGSPRIFARFVPDLELLRRPALVPDRARPRHDVERQRGGERPEIADRRAQVPRTLAERPGARDLVQLGVERVHAGLACPGGRLVGSDHHLAQAEHAVQREHRHDQGERGAVRGRDDPLGTVRGLLRVDFGHDQGYLGVHPERAGVVHDHRAVAGRDRRPVRRYLVRHVEHGQVDAVEHVRSQRHDLDLPAADPQPPPGRAGRGDQPDLPPHVGARGKQVEHHRPHRPGGPHHGQRRLVPRAGRGGPAGRGRALPGRAAGHRPLPP